MTLAKAATESIDRSLTHRQAFWACLGIASLFILLSDGVVLLLSSSPYLFGLIDANSTRFEETLLYLPAIKNFSFFDPLLADFTGTRAVHALSPIPYISLAVAKLLYYVAGGSLNGSIVAIHSLIILEVGLVYALCRHYVGTPLAT